MENGRVGYVKGDSNNFSKEERQYVGFYWSYLLDLYEKQVQSRGDSKSFLEFLKGKREKADDRQKYFIDAIVEEEEYEIGDNTIQDEESPLEDTINGIEDFIQYATKQIATLEALSKEKAEKEAKIAELEKQIKDAKKLLEEYTQNKGTPEEYTQDEGTPYGGD